MMLAAEQEPQKCRFENQKNTSNDKLNSTTWFRTRMGYGTKHNKTPTRPLEEFGRQTNPEAWKQTLANHFDIMDAKITASNGQKNRRFSTSHGQNWTRQLWRQALHVREDVTEKNHKYPQSTLRGTTKIQRSYQQTAQRTKALLYRHTANYDKATQKHTRSNLQSRFTKIKSAHTLMDSKWTLDFNIQLGCENTSRQTAGVSLRIQHLQSEQSQNATEEWICNYRTYKVAFKHRSMTEHNKNNPCLTLWRTNSSHSHEQDTNVSSRRIVEHKTNAPTHYGAGNEHRHSQTMANHHRNTKNKQTPLERRTAKKHTPIKQWGLQAKQITRKQQSDKQSHAKRNAEDADW